VTSCGREARVRDDRAFARVHPNTIECLNPRRRDGVRGAFLAFPEVMTMPFVRHPSAAARRAVRDINPTPYWLDSPARPEPTAALSADIDADLVIVGAGFTGLWAAICALEENPQRDVVVLEGGTAAWAASGRNGGFLAASLTHGLGNGLARWPQEMPGLLAAGHENLRQIKAAIDRYDIDCDWRHAGEITAATEPHHVAELQHLVDSAQAMGEDVSWLGAQEIRSIIDSPTYRGAMWDHRGVAMIDPARLAWGMRDVALGLGARLYEHTPVVSVEPQAAHLRLMTGTGSVVRAEHVLLATNVFPGLVPEIRRRVVPVYDYVVLTEPLTPEQRGRIGWLTDAGVNDAGNQFHYYRMTSDGRILFGGYDAIYRFGGRVNPADDHNPTSWARLVQHFWQTFPQLRDVGFSHAWGGSIDTCTRFSAFWGTKFDERLAYVTGYTGLGVGASRFGALTALDLLAKRSSARTRLPMVQAKPLPFPAAPLRWAGIQMTRMSLDRADRRGGRRNLWLRGLDAAGLGFDS
jgi:glycine/D-amino acid oxidase-like deaminating enzyme